MPPPKAPPQATKWEQLLGRATVMLSAPMTSSTSTGNQIVRCRWWVWGVFRLKEVEDIGYKRKPLSGLTNALQDWIPSETDANAGFGHYGSCCFELDIWEANEISTVIDLFHVVKTVWKPLLSSSCLSADVYRPYIKLIARYTHLTPVTQSDSNDAKEPLVGITSPMKGDSISILKIEICYRDW